MSKVPGWGPRDAKIMVVGEAPAREEQKLGRPFVGRSGKELRTMCRQVNFDLDECYTTNASLHPVVGPKDKFFFEKGRPSPILIEGLVQLYRDIQEIKPNVVIACGNYALWALRQHQQIMRWRGSILWADLPAAGMGVKVVPTIHPAALLRGSTADGFTGMWKWRPVVILDLLRAKQQSAFPELRLTPRELVIIEDVTSAEGIAAIERLHAAKELVADIETFGGLNLACVGFGDMDPTWAACFVYNNSPTMKAVYRFLLEGPAIVHGQNLMYDATALDQLDIRVRHIGHDTMIAQQVLMTDLPKGLDFQCSINSDIPYYKEEGKIWKKSGIKNWRQFWEYNAKDICATTDSLLKQREDLADEPRFADTFVRRMANFDTFREGTFRGWAVDRARLDAHIMETEAKTDKLQAELDKAAGYTFNVRSHTQVKDLVYKKLDLPKRTKFDKASGGTKLTADAGALMHMVSMTGNRIPFLIDRVRKQKKLLSNYFNDNVLSADGRIRSTCNIAGTRTGRVSYSKPLWGPGLGIQTIPHIARDIFVADPGYEIGNFDQMQAEAVIVAYYAQDPIHMDCFRTGKDAHRVTACLLGDIDPVLWETIDKKGIQRDLAKRCNHAFNYHMGAIVFMYTVNKYWDPDIEGSLRLTQDAAKGIHEKYHMVRPALQNYWKYIEGELRENRTLIGPTGTKWEFLDKWSQSMLNDAYSRIPQGTVAETNNIGISRVVADPELREAGVQYLTQTHDSNTWQWPPENRDFIVPRIVKHLEVQLHICGYNIIVPIDGGIGPNWAVACDPSMTGGTVISPSRLSVEV